MNSTEKRELLSAYVNGELARTQREFVEQHLEGCADCRTALADFTWVRHRLASLKDEPVTSSMSIKEATMSTIAAKRPVGLPIEKLVRPALVAAAVLAAVIVPIVVVLSGGGPGSGIAQAYDVLAGLDSYRMAGTTVSSFADEISESAFEWEFVAPDRYRGSITTDGETREFIVVGGDQYSKVPDRPDGALSFTTIVNDNILSPVPSREGTLRLLDSLTGVEELSDETIGEAETHHYLGSVDIDRIIDAQATGLDPQSADYDESLAMPDVLGSIAINVELWISRDDSTIRQMKMDIESPITGSGGEVVGTSTMSTFVRYFDFNVDIHIAPPVTPSGEFEPGWRASAAGPPEPAVTVSER